ncbi:MAG: TlyA family RNA methyltransferase [Bifidobacteriaceae bacterium]|nr:TlyA family RNA methyltransferase [Bifidobacteriaceae bacterium]
MKSIRDEYSYTNNSEQSSQLENLTRLDVLLMQLQYASTRNKAQRLIKEGAVQVNDVTVTKPSTKCGVHDRISVVDQDSYVSRGAYKLLGALHEFHVDVRNSLALDIGASTGGFTQVLLERGAQHVIALDVGHGQLDPRIANSSHVTEMSGVNIRNIQPCDLPYQPNVVVSDVSFISLTYVLPVVKNICASNAQIILLIKPQFEVGKGKLGKGGIVESEDLRRQAVDTVCECAIQCGFKIEKVIPSPIEGTHGNKEYLLYARFEELK